MLNSLTIVGSAGQAAETAKDRARQAPKAFDREQLLRAIEISLPEIAPGRECVEHALEVRGVSLRFGGVRALTDVSFGVNDGELFSIIGPTGARREELEHRRKVEEIIDFLDLQSVRKATAGTLPYGLRKRVELARAMALEPKLILLGEPMAGMNFEEKEDMARYIVDLNEEF